MQDSLLRVESHIPAELVAESIWTGIKASLGSLPRVETAGFECRLDHDPQVDFSLQLRRYNLREVGQLAARFPGMHALDALGAAWQTPGASLHAGLRDFWVEFDLETPSGPLIAPGLFLTLQPPATLAPAPLVATVAGYFDHTIPRHALENLNRLSERLPAGCVLHRLGLLFGRPAKTIRVEISLPAAMAASCLERCGWPADVRAFAATCGSLISLSDRMSLALDLGESVGPRVGLQCYIHEVAKPLPRWREFLDSLAGAGLCLPAKREAVLAWPGGDRRRRELDTWEAAVMAAGAVTPRTEEDICARSISHVKVNYEAGGFRQAKVYLLWRHVRVVK